MPKIGLAEYLDRDDVPADVKEAIKSGITEHKQAEKEIKKSKELLESITRGITESIFLLSKDCKILWANKAALEKYSYEMDNILEKYCYQVTHLRESPCEPPRDPCPIYELQKTGKTQILPHSHFDKEGNKRFVELSAYPIEDEIGEIVKFVYVIKDITLPKRVEMALRKRTHDLGKRVKEMNCLYGISKLVEKRDILLEELLQGIVDLIPPAWQHPGITCARIILEDQEFITKNFRETIWKQVSDINLHGDRIGIVEVCYLKEKPEIDEGPFLKEERILINVIAERVGSIISRKRAEEKIKEYTENLEKMVDERTKALKESEEKLKAILAGIGDLITIQNKDLDIIWANQQVKDLWGDVVGKKCYDVYKWLDTPCPDCTVERVFNEGKTIVTERPSILPDGSGIHLLTTSSPIRDAEGNIAAVVEMIKDITERKQLEKKLTESEERYRGLYESSIDGISSADMNGKINDCNQAFADMLGYTKEELCKLTILDLRPHKWHDKMAKIHTDQVLTRGYSDEVELELIKKDGTLIPVSVRLWLSKDKEGKPTGTWAIIRDISDWKQVEKSLRESEAKFRTLAEQSPNMIFINKKGSVVYANKRCEEITGYTKEEFYSPDFDFFCLIAPESIDVVKASFSRHVKGEDIEPYGYALITKDGRSLQAIITTKLIDYRDEKAILGIVTDITELKRMHNALIESEQRYRSLFEESSDAVYITTREGKFVDANHALLNLFDYTRDDLFKLDVMELYVYPADRVKFQQEIEQKVSVRDYELKLRKKDGTVMDCLLTSTVRRANDGSILGYQGIIRDVTEQRLAEEALQTSKELYKTLASLLLMQDKKRHDKLPETD